MTGAGEGGAVVRETAAASAPWWRRADWGALLVVLVVLASSATSLGNGFAYDDIPIVRDNAAVHHWRWPWEFFTESYWPPPRGLALFRPFTMWLFSVQWLIADWAVVTFHIVSITAYAATALLVLDLARRLMSQSVALAVATLWAAHPVHVEVVGNVVGQSELWVALSSLLAIRLVYVVFEDGQLGMGRMVCVLGCVAVAISAKENGIILPFLLAGMLLARARGGRVPTTLESRCWLLIRAMVYMGCVYFALRYRVLGTLGGDGPRLEIADLESGQRLLVALGVLVSEARLMLFGGPLAADYAPPLIPLHAELDLWHLGGVGLVAAWWLASLLLWRRHRIAWPVLWAPLALAPTSNVLFASGIIMSERALFVPSIGILLTVGMLVEHSLTLGFRRLRRAVRVAVGALVAAVVLSGAHASAVRQRVWQDTPTLVASSLVDDPRIPKWHVTLGMAFLNAGDFERAETHFRIANAVGPSDIRMLYGMYRVLERQGRCEEALPFYRRLEAQYAPEPEFQLGHIACLLRLRRYSQARRRAWVQRATARHPTPYSILLSLADSALAATDSSHPGNTWSSQGRPVSPSGARIDIEVGPGGRLTRIDR